VYGGAYKSDNVKDLRLLGITEKKPISKLANRNKLILPNNIRNKRKNNINRKIMWGKSLPSNLAIMSWRFYSNRIKEGLNNLRK
tara:strand:- start:192 stop:443 length:252 start_codon:yes stop_codon:yes gene_type:complete